MKHTAVLHTLKACTALTLFTLGPVQAQILIGQTVGVTGSAWVPAAVQATV